LSCGAMLGGEPDRSTFRDRGFLPAMRRPLRPPSSRRGVPALAVAQPLCARKSLCLLTPSPASAPRSESVGRFWLRAYPGLVSVTSGHSRSCSSAVAALAVTFEVVPPISTLARGSRWRLSHQAGGRSEPPKEPITTRTPPSRRYVSVAVRGLPDPRPVVVRSSTGIPATRPRGWPPLVR